MAWVQMGTRVLVSASGCKWMQGCEQAQEHGQTQVCKMGVSRHNGMCESAQGCKDMGG